MHNVWYISLVYRFNNIYCENFEKSILKAETNKKKLYTKCWLWLIINYKQFNFVLNKIVK